mmetsp:Transcript_1349/g.3894  ORF Transcript_1349/g.3894 Transcript_1349/m.3894 type:complete len:287 (+) Transcript_1349:1669-2529(+)
MAATASLPFFASSSILNVRRSTLLATSLAESSASSSAARAFLAKLSARAMVSAAAFLAKVASISATRRSLSISPSRASASPTIASSTCSKELGPTWVCLWPWRTSGSAAPPARVPDWITASTPLPAKLSSAGAGSSRKAMGTSLNAGSMLPSNAPPMPPSEPPSAGCNLVPAGLDQKDAPPMALRMPLVERPVSSSGSRETPPQGLFVLRRIWSQARSSCWHSGADAAAEASAPRPVTSLLALRSLVLALERLKHLRYSSACRRRQMVPTPGLRSNTQPLPSCNSK